MSALDLYWTLVIVAGAMAGLGLLVRHALQEARPGPGDGQLPERDPE